MKKHEHNQKGFTLIELMVTAAIAIIFALIGIPAFNSMVANNRAVSQANTFVTAVNLAKNEAVAKGIPVTLCASNAASSTTCGGSGNWANGFFVFQDDDADSVYDAGDGEILLRQWQEMENGTSIATTVGNIRYNSLGENSSEAKIQFLLTQSGTSGAQTRYVCINVIGQISTQTTACP